MLAGSGHEIMIDQPVTGAINSDETNALRVVEINMIDPERPAKGGGGRVTAPEPDRMIVHVASGR